MNYETDHDETILVDLGSVSSETHGVGGDIHPDAPQGRVQLGILVD